MVFVVYTMEEDFGIFVVYTMEGDFRISWCTPWKGKMVFVVYTMEPKNGFHGVYHGRGFWHFPDDYQYQIQTPRLKHKKLQTIVKLRMR